MSEMDRLLAENEWLRRRMARLERDREMLRLLCEEQRRVMHDQRMAREGVTAE